MHWQADSLPLVPPGKQLTNVQSLNYGWIHQLKLNIFFYKLLHEEYTKEEIYVGFLLEVYSKEYYGNTEYTYLCSFLAILECTEN